MTIKGKAELRKEISAMRRSASDDWVRENSLAAAKLLRKLPEYRASEVILAYVDLRHEVETGELISAALEEGKRVAVPRVEGRLMRFYFISSREKDLESGYFGIREPVEGLESADEEADRHASLMVMPGVAFDENRHRVGYGGGFYDRYLEAHPMIRTAALAFEFQVREEVPYEEYDIRPDMIVTERRVIL